MSRSHFRKAKPGRAGYSCLYYLKPARVCGLVPLLIIPLEGPCASSQVDISGHNDRGEEFGGIEGLFAFNLMVA